MEVKLEGVREYTFDELKKEMAEEDALFTGTGALVLGVTWIDFQRLKKKLEEMEEFRVIYATFSTAHLRIVKIDQYNAFQEWKKNRGE